jgi:hypothetical protein
MPSHGAADRDKERRQAEAAKMVAKEARPVILDRLNTELGVSVDDTSAPSPLRRTGKAPSQIHRADMYRKTFNVKGAHRPKLEQIVEEYCNEQNWDLSTRKGKKKFKCVLDSVVNSLKNSANHIRGGGTTRKKERHREMLVRRDAPDFPTLDVATELFSKACPDTNLATLTVGVLETIFHT